jgi:hypothetical protein
VKGAANKGSFGSVFLSLSLFSSDEYLLNEMLHVVCLKMQNFIFEIRYYYISFGCVSKYYESMTKLLN